MNEKLSKAKDVLKRVWDKVIAFLKLMWSYIVKAYQFIAPKAVSGAKFVYEKACVFFKTVVKDKQKLILAIILAVAILFSCIAVVRAVKGVVNGIAGIFTSDKAEEDNDKGDVAESEEAVVITDCEHCENGVCIHCENGFVDCPDCENGDCIKCGGTGENGSKMMSLLLDNCTACKGSGECDDCNENYMIDCRYCEGGKCSECAE